jgi:hypothetical protein
MLDKLLLDFVCSIAYLSPSLSPQSLQSCLTCPCFHLVIEERIVELCFLRLHLLSIVERQHVELAHAFLVTSGNLADGLVAFYFKLGLINDKLYAFLLDRLIVVQEVLGDSVFIMNCLVGTVHNLV